MPIIPAFNPIQYLLLRKFPTMHQIPPYREESLLKSSDFRHEDPKLVAKNKKLAKEIEAYRKQLNKKSTAEIEIIVAEEQKKQAIEFAEKRAADLQKRFYNDSSAKADYDFWSRAAHWTLEEAVALTFGKNPEVVNWMKLHKYHQEFNPDEFVVKYYKLRELTRRATVWKKLYDPILPSLYVSWIKQNQIDFPKELEDLLAARGNSSLNWFEEYKKLKEQYAQDLGEILEIKRQRDELLATLKKVSPLIQKKAQEKQTYTSPYIELMLEAINANHLSNTDQSKKDSLKDWFIKNAPEGIAISDKKADMMATLVRLPESGVGGNKKIR